MKKNETVTIDPTKVRNAGEEILSLADILGVSLPQAERIHRTYEQGYWYAIGRMDEATGGHGSHSEADLFGRARATAFHRMNTGQTSSTGSMMDDYADAAKVVEVPR